MNTRATASEPSPALRGQRKWWRDRRVLTGLAVVLVSALAGAMLISAARATEAHWVVNEDVMAGQAVERSQLRQVELSVPSSVARQLAAADTLPADGVWRREVAAGSLLTKDLVSSEDSGGQLVPFRVALGSIPDAVRVGDTVNVWVGPGPQESDALKASKLLTEVPVVEIRIDPLGTHKLVVVDVGPSGPGASVVSSLTTRHVTVVRVR